MATKLRTISAVPIALLGFSDFERQALDGALARARRRPGGAAYERVLSVDEAVYVVADGDDAGSQALLEELGRVADTVFVGLNAPGEAAAWVMRPVTPERVLRELDELHRSRCSPDSAPLPWSLPSDFDSGLVHLDRLESEPTPVAAPGRRIGDAPAPRRSPRVDEPPAVALPAPEGWPGHSGPVPLAPWLKASALVVDDSAIARHYLQRLLLAYGLQVEAVASADAALAALAVRDYGLVFVDVDLGEHHRHGGLKLCRQIRLGAPVTGDRPPLVVMVSAFHDPVDQVRGTLAGAEAYLGKPLQRPVLDRLLRQLGFECEPAVAAVAPSAELGLHGR